MYMKKTEPPQSLDSLDFHPLILSKTKTRLVLATRGRSWDAHWHFFSPIKDRLLARDKVSVVVFRARFFRLLLMQVEQRRVIVTVLSEETASVKTNLTQAHALAGKSTPHTRSTCRCRAGSPWTLSCCRLLPPLLGTFACAHAPAHPPHSPPSE